MLGLCQFCALTLVDIDKNFELAVMTYAEHCPSFYVVRAALLHYETRILRGLIRSAAGSLIQVSNEVGHVIDGT